MTHNQTTQAKLQSVLQEVAFGLYANSTQELFKRLVAHLASTFEASYAFVGLLVEDADEPTIETIAVNAHGRRADNFSYHLAGTPCENVVGRGVCSHTDGVQTRFPNDHMLVNMRVESYIGAPLFDSQGKPLGLVAVLDTTTMLDIELKTEMLKVYTLRAARELERHDASVELREKEQRFHSLVSNIPGVVYRCALDANWTMEFISDGIVLLSGYATDDFINNKVRTYASIIHPDDIDLVETSVLNAVKSKQPFVIDYRIIDRAGKVHWVYEKGQAQADESGNVRCLDGVIFDVTSRKEAEEELESYRNHLEDLVEHRTAELTRANQELESFSYSVSHDLRAPLRSIDGFSSALLEDYYDILDETARSHLNRVRKSAQRMGALIDDLLAFSRVSRYEIEKHQLDLSDLAHDIVAAIGQQQPREGVTINIQANMTATGDVHLLRIALDNLLSNAWKYSRNTEKAIIEFGSKPCKDGDCYFVRDNGIGFDMNYADKLFGVFQRLHGSEYEGTGIGLATAKRVIDRHGGRIWGDSRVGEGTCFCFTLEPDN